MSRLVAHAKAEMEKAGLYDKDADYGGFIPDAVMALVEAHAAQGHSGMSHAMTLQIFNKVINYQTLTPITSNPVEWMHVGGNAWQNLRQPSTFSEDGGQTWYDLDDPEKKNFPDRLK
jgi:hypothetical protein